MNQEKTAWRSICASLLAAACLMMPALAAATAGQGGRQSAANANTGQDGLKGGTPTEPRPARVRFLDSGSGETKAAREKRLKRECKGRPNAGACLGMTR